MKKLFCNMCEKELDELHADTFGLHYDVGYGSKYDGSKINLDLCCDCFDNLIDTILPNCKLNPITR